MVELMRPNRGGYLRPFGAAIFIRDYLAGKGPQYGVDAIDPARGAPQTDIHGAYKSALHRAFAEDAAVRREEQVAGREGRGISTEEIERWTAYYLERIPYKLTKMRYHSFVTYFRLLKALGWVEETGETEPSAIQEYYPPAPPRVFYRLTRAGRVVGIPMLSDPIVTLYGYGREKRSPRERKYMRPPAPRGYARRRAQELGRGISPAPPPPSPPEAPGEVEVPEAVQKRWDTLLERIRGWPTPRPADAERLLRRFVEETGVAPLDNALDRLQEYRDITRAEFETTEEYREARAEAWQEFLDALDEVELYMG